MSISSTGPTAVGKGVVRAAYSVAETAVLLDLSEATIYRLIGRGIISSVLIGHSRRIPASAIQKVLAAEDQRAAKTGKSLPVRAGFGRLNIWPSPSEEGEPQ